MASDLGTEIVVALREPEADDASVALAEELALALAVPSRLLHVEAAPGDVATAIAEGLAPQSILVIHSEHANRWSGKWSIAEHVIDQWGGITIAIGPRYQSSLQAGPVMTALDGSSESFRAAEPAQMMAEILNRPIEYCTVVPSADEHKADSADRPSLIAPRFVYGNDPVSVLLSEAERNASALIVLAARGDRSSVRSTISRTCSGIIAGATQPVMIVGSKHGQTGTLDADPV